MSYKLRLVAALLAGFVAVGGLGGIGLMSMASAQPAGVKINEVELNPRGWDAGGEWVEIYNPTAADVNIGDYTIKTWWHSNSVTVPAGTVIGAGRFYVLVVDGEKLSNANLLTLVDSAGQQVDRTPALMDRSDSSLTWQRLPDGGSSWRLTEGTNAAANDPRTFKPATPGGGQQGATSPAGTSDMCAGTTQCMQGKVVRVADADTVYIRAGTDTYKVDLSLSKARRNAAADAFTRAMCLGNDVKVDPDDRQPGKGVVYCASTSLNQQLLDNSFASIDKRQCATSEFASQDWAKRYGC